MLQKYYLLATLIEMQDCTTDSHSLYATLEKAERDFKLKLADCRENFEGQRGEALIDLPRCYEWRTEDGFGYSVTIEEVEPQ